ncbi:MAG: helix-turn-helix domain-containing protein [Myxococcota bacterium]
MPPKSATNATSRRAEVLEAALELLADEGYAGASLRKLAARLGMAQPSLYHYFRTKEDLVEQVLATYAGQMFQALSPDQLPTTLEDVPRVTVETAVRVYQRPTHPLFVRVAISVSRVNPRFGTLMRRVFVEQATWGIQQMMKPFVERGEIDADDAVDLVRMLLNAIGLRLIEDKVMFAAHEPGPDFDRYVRFVIATGHAQLAALAAQRD